MYLFLYVPFLRLFCNVQLFVRIFHVRTYVHLYLELEQQIMNTSLNTPLWYQYITGTVVE